jgi:hypothetical protein
MRLFEIHDQKWFPQRLRDLTTDALQFTLGDVDLYKPIVSHLRTALMETGSTRIVDLCSGAGGPLISLSRALGEVNGVPITICLTDKYPHCNSLDMEKPGQSTVEFVSRSVDATDIPEDLHGFRTIFSSFHHFSPLEAREILQDAIRKKEGIGVFEGAGSHALTLLMLFLMPLGALLLTPFIRPFRWSRLYWTYVVPVIPFLLWFDGIMSCFRSYSVPELDKLVAELPTNDYKWQIGEERGGFLPIAVTYLIGYRNLNGRKPPELANLDAILES